MEIVATEFATELLIEVFVWVEIEHGLSWSAISDSFLSRCCGDCCYGLKSFEFGRIIRTGPVIKV